MIYLIILINVCKFACSYNLNADIVGHRGGSLQLIPQHTVASWSLGAQSGAEYIEPDIMMSKDGYLIVHHDIDLAIATDVANHPEFADRFVTFEVWHRGDPDNYTWYTESDITNNIQTYTGWPIFNFTLDELKTLKAINTYSSRTNGYPSPFDGYFDVLTFNESLELVNNLSLIFDREIGIFPEPKFYFWYKHMGYGSMIQKMIISLETYGFMEYDDISGYYKPILFNDESNGAKSKVIFQNNDPNAFPEYYKYVDIDTDDNIEIPTYLSLYGNDFFGDTNWDISTVEWALTFVNGINIGFGLLYLDQVLTYKQELETDFYINLGSNIENNPNDYIKSMDNNINSIFSQATETGIVTRNILNQLIDPLSEINNLSWIHCSMQPSNQDDDSDNNVVLYSIIFACIGLFVGIIIGSVCLYYYTRSKYILVKQKPVKSQVAPTSETPLVETK